MKKTELIEKWYMTGDYRTSNAKTVNSQFLMDKKLTSIRNSKLKIDELPHGHTQVYIIKIEN